MLYCYLEIIICKSNVLLQMLIPYVKIDTADKLVSLIFSKFSTVARSTFYMFLYDNLSEVTKIRQINHQ